METIKVHRNTKNEFEKLLLDLRIKEKKNIFADEFINILLNDWKLKHIKSSIK